MYYVSEPGSPELVCLRGSDYPGCDHFWNAVLTQAQRNLLIHVHVYVKNMKILVCDTFLQHNLQQFQHLPKWGHCGFLHDWPFKC